MFLDESAANERTSDRKFGWSPVGVTPHVYESTKRSERWSILPAYTIDGFITWEISQGLFDTDLFNAFIQHKILPICTYYRNTGCIGGPRCGTSASASASEGVTSDEEFGFSNFAEFPSRKGLCVPLLEGSRVTIRPSGGVSSAALPSLIDILHVFICGGVTFK